MNLLHRWYCRSDRWARRLRDLVPWALDGGELVGNVLEIGPGPGRTTDLLRQRAKALTVIEVDRELARRLRQRMAGSSVTVVEGDATAMPFPDASFDAAVSFTMLHHVPAPELQDRLLAETRRVLKPGGHFLGSDSTPNLLWNLAHLFDTCVPVDPRTFGGRLEAAGLTDVEIELRGDSFRFFGRKA